MRHLRRGEALFDVREEMVAEVPLPVAYAIGNALLQINIEVRQMFGLKPVDMLVLHVLIVAGAQRTMRRASRGAPLKRKLAIAPDERGTLSRRAIAQVLDLPFETVRRATARLMAQGLITERCRGKLVVTDQVVDPESFIPFLAAITRRWTATTERLAELGVVRLI